MKIFQKNIKKKIGNEKIRMMQKQILIGRNELKLVWYIKTIIDIGRL